MASTDMASTNQLIFQCQKDMASTDQLNSRWGLQLFQHLGRHIKAQLGGDELGHHAALDAGSPE